MSWDRSGAIGKVAQWRAVVEWCGIADMRTLPLASGCEAVEDSRGLYQPQQGRQGRQEQGWRWDVQACQGSAEGGDKKGG